MMKRSVHPDRRVKNMMTNTSMIWIPIFCVEEIAECFSQNWKIIKTFKTQFIVKCLISVLKSVVLSTFCNIFATVIHWEVSSFDFRILFRLILFFFRYYLLGTQDNSGRQSATTSFMGDRAPLVLIIFHY